MNRVVVGWHGPCCRRTARVLSAGGPAARRLGHRPDHLLRRLLSSASTEEAEAEAKPQKFRILTKDKSEYQKAVSKLRGQWRQEELERQRSTQKDVAAERRLIQERKAEKLAKKKIIADKNKAKHLARVEEQREKARTELVATIARLEERRVVRVKRQENMVRALEEESALWLKTDEEVDAKIDDALWEQPGSTGLVTNESHWYWRYVLDFERAKETPSMYQDDPYSIVPTEAEQERARVATTTERLIRTQAPDLTAFHQVMENAREVADAIKDLEVTETPPRVHPSYAAQREAMRKAGRFDREPGVPTHPMPTEKGKGKGKGKGGTRGVDLTGGPMPE